MKVIYIQMIVVLMFVPILNAFAQENFSPREGARIVFVGDIFLGNWAVEFSDKYGPDYPFRGCEEYLREVDLAVGNLEGPITAEGTPFPDKEFLLKMPPGVEKGLAEANIRCLNLANNHILDYGVEGLNATFKALEASNIRYFGAGENMVKAFKETVFTLDNHTYAFLGFSATFPEEFWAADSTAGTAFPWREPMIETIERCDSLYDAVIVSFHWSAELREYPKDYQVELAHTCIDYGADLIIGHHPHIIQGIEIYQGVPIFYSLGNFTFASYSENVVTGMMVTADFRKGKLFATQIVPINVYNAEINFQPRPLTGNKKIEFIEKLSRISQELNPEKVVITNAGSIVF